MSETKLIELVKEKRPNIKNSSLNMYLNNLKKLNKDLDNEDLYDVDILKEKELVEQFFQDKKPNTVKNYLASFVVLLMAVDANEKLITHYRTEMELLGEEIGKFHISQTKSPSQEKNWVEYDTLQKVAKELKREVMKKEILKKDDLKKKDFDLLQRWVVASLYVLDAENNPPLRADFSPMKIIHISDYNKLDEPELKKNYLVVKGKIKKFFHLGEYKTDKKYGEKLIPIGVKLNSVLNAYIPHAKDDYLITNSKGQPMNPNQLSKYVKKIFSTETKDIGITMIRHIVITHLFPPNLEDKMKTADLMAHSPNQQSLYSKK